MPDMVALLFKYASRAVYADNDGEHGQTIFILFYRRATCNFENVCRYQSISALEVTLLILFQVSVSRRAR